MIKAAGFLLIALAVFLAGCATMSEGECITADWRSIGFEDAVNGLPASRIGSHREACAKHGVRPNLGEYQSGHEEGLTVFCTSGNGYSRGTSGYQYTGICPASLEPDFLAGYASGREIYQLSSRIQSLESEQRNNSRELDTIDEDLVRKEERLFDEETSEQQRREIYNEIAELNERRGELTQRNEELVRQAADANAELRLLQSRQNY